MRTSKIALTVGALLTSLTLAACGDSGSGSDPFATRSSSASSAAGGSISIGSADFPESALLAEIYAGALKAKGVTVNEPLKLNIGSRETYIPALKDGSIDLIPEYTGVLTQYFNKDAKATDAEGVYTELKAALPDTLTVLDKSAAEDKDAVVVTKETAAKYSLKSIADLAGKSQKLTLGGPPEWKTRPTGVPGLKKVYGLTFKQFRALDAGGPLSVNALRNGQVDATNLFTTDPNIVTKGFVVLDDPKHLFAAQNVVPLITKAKVTPDIEGALNAVSAKLDTPTLAALLKDVVTDKKDPQAVAKEFLSKNGLG